MNSFPKALLKNSMGSYLNVLKDITTFVFDIDGVLSDGKVVIMPDGEQLRRMSTRDGYALQLAKKKAIMLLLSVEEDRKPFVLASPT